MLALSNCSCSPLRSFLTYLPFLEKASATSIVSAAVGYATISNSFENGSGEFDGCILSLCKAIEREWNASFVHTKRRELGINVLQYYFRHQPGLGKTSTICDNVDFNRSGKEMGNYLAWNPPTLGQSIHALTTKPPPNLPLEKDFILRELESIKDIRNESAHECITKEQADSHIATIEKAVQNRLFDELLIAKKNEKPNAFASVAKKEWARLSSFNSRLANDLRQSP